MRIEIKGLNQNENHVMNFLEKLWKEDLYTYAIFFLPIVLVNFPKGIVLSIIFLVLSAIPHIKKPDLNHLNKVHLLLLGYYLLHVFGLFFTENLGYGGKDLETKFSFFLFPILFFFTQSSLTELRIKMAKKGFVIGVSIAMLLSYSRSIMLHFQGVPHSFSSVEFGFQMHSTYLSVCYLIAFVFLFFNNQLFGKFHNQFKWVFFVLFLGGIFMLASLSSLLCLLILAFIYAFRLYKQSTNKFLKGTVILIPIALVVSLFSVKELRRELDFTYFVIYDFVVHNDVFVQKHNGNEKSSMVRLLLYNFAAETMVEHPFGVGTGDVKDALFSTYKNNNFDYFVDKKLNAHSQFFQSGVAFGFLGMFYVIYLFYTPLRWFKKYQSKEIFYAVLIIGVTCLFESYLERQVGVITFSYLLFTLAPLQFNGENFGTKASKIISK